MHCNHKALIVIAVGDYCQQRHFTDTVVKVEGLGKDSEISILIHAKMNVDGTKGDIVAVTPDLITIIDSDTGKCESCTPLVIIINNHTCVILHRLPNYNWRNMLRSQSCCFGIASLSWYDYSWSNGGSGTKGIQSCHIDWSHIIIMI